MINRFLLFFVLILISCVPQESAVKLGGQSEGAIVSPEPTISNIVVQGNELIINGNGFAGITGVTIKDPDPINGFQKPFQVTSATIPQLISIAIDNIPLPVGKAMELIFSNAYGQSTYPIKFTLEPNSVKTFNILDEAVTPQKLLGIKGPSPGAPTAGQPNIILIWNGTGFEWGADAGSGGTAGVTSITKGTGIVGAPSAGQTGSVTIAVNTGTTGNSAETKIPFFNGANKIVMDGTADPAGSIAGLSFRDGTKVFNIYNDNALRIDSNSNPDIFVMDEQGDLVIKGNITAGNSTVCTVANGACTSSQVNRITATPPVVVSSPTGNVNISLNSTGVVTSISAQPGINVTSNSPTAGNVQIGADFGPPAGTETTVQKWFKNLDDLGSLIPNNNAVIIGDGSAFQVSSGPSLLLRIGAQPVNSNLTAIGNLTPSIGSIIVGGNTNVWTGQTIPNCGANYLVQADTTFNPLGPFLTCSNVGSSINFGNIATNNQSGVTLNASSAGVPGEIHFVAGAGIPTIAIPANSVGFKAPATVATPTMWTLPSGDGTISGQALTTNAGGVLSWSTNAVGNVVGPPASTDEAIARFDLATGRLIQNSGVLIDDANSITGVSNFTAKGLNTNNPINVGPPAAIDFMTGRNNLGALNAGQTSADLSFEIGQAGGGFKHYISTTHNNVVSNNQNSFRFYLNNSTVATGSSTPGTGNILGMSITAVGVGILNSNPTSALDVTGAAAISGNTSVGGNLSVTGTLGIAGQTTFNSGANSSTFPLIRGTNGYALTTDGAGALSWTNVGSANDVSNAGASTDNAIARFDGVTGKLIQNSAVTIDDTGNMLMSGSAIPTLQISGNTDNQQSGTLFLSQGNAYGYKVYYDALNTFDGLRITERSNNIENIRMSFKAGGNVGIGNSDPANLLDVSGTFRATGNSTIGGTLAVTGASTLTGNTSVGGTLGVTGASTLTGNTSVGGTLAVTGASTLTGNTSVGGTLGVTGASTLGSTLDVTGNTTLNGTRINGTNTLELGLGVAGKETNAGKISYNGIANGFLGIVGAGTTATNRAIRMWDDVYINQNLGVGTGANVPAATIHMGGPVNGTLLLRANAVMGGGDYMRIRFEDPDGGTGAVNLAFIDDGVRRIQIQAAVNCDLGNGAGATMCTSDSRLKDNVVEIKNAVEKIKKIRGVEFDWNQKSNIPGQHNIGVIAQEVMKVFPESVHRDQSTGYYMADYASLVAPLIQATKEQQTQIEKLVNEVKELRKELKKVKEKMDGQNL